ncbi:hypothetical protein NDU88_006200 [Pleurodeles waltl]|uniref:Uncharacterized protein n=1 Tax=Pleurodeles waltl TaxID=8319 RepID=A0AAV7WBT6_PLEWA|nr:hypothetical protein NDU88_006200 [Pleurodeles waltl]
MCRGGSLGLRGPSDSSSAGAATCAVTCFRAQRASLWLYMISRPVDRPHLSPNRQAHLKAPAPSHDPPIPSHAPQRVLTSTLVTGRCSASASPANHGSVTPNSNTVHYGRGSTPGPTARSRRSSVGSC